MYTSSAMHVQVTIVSLIITKKFIPDEITKNELTTRTKVEEIEIMAQGIYSE